MLKDITVKVLVGLEEALRDGNLQHGETEVEINAVLLERVKEQPELLNALLWSCNNKQALGDCITLLSGSKICNAPAPLGGMTDEWILKGLEHRARQLRQIDANAQAEKEEQKRKEKAGTLKAVGEFLTSPFDALLLKDDLHDTYRLRSYYSNTLEKLGANLNFSTELAQALNSEICIEAISERIAEVEAEVLKRTAEMQAVQALDIERTHRVSALKKTWETNAVFIAGGKNALNCYNSKFMPQSDLESAMEALVWTPLQGGSNFLSKPHRLQDKDLPACREDCEGQDADYMTMKVHSMPCTEFKLFTDLKGMISDRYKTCMAAGGPIDYSKIVQAADGTSRENAPIYDTDADYMHVEIYPEAKVGWCRSCASCADDIEAHVFMATVVINWFDYTFKRSFALFDKIHYQRRSAIAG